MKARSSRNTKDEPSSSRSTDAALTTSSRSPPPPSRGGPFQQALEAIKRAAELHQAANKQVPYDPAPECERHPAQLALVTDPSRWIVAPAGRRAGKTDGEERWLIDKAASMPGTTAFYVSTSIERAIDTFWDDLAIYVEQRNLGVCNYGRHSVRLRNGSMVKVTGVENKKRANALRGRKKVAAWAIDEAQDWPDDLLRYFYQDVVYPSLADVRGSVLISGTGGPPRGFWYERTVDPEFSCHRFLTTDNPYLPEGEAQRLIDKACKDRGVTIDDPSIQREFFARFVSDAGRQCIVFDQRRNTIRLADVPSKVSFVCAFDFGSLDAVAGVVYAYSSEFPHAVIVDAVKEHGASSARQAEFVRELEAKWRARGPIASVKGDPGGGGKGIMLSLKEGHDLRIDNAEKDDKAAAIRLMRGSFLSGSLVVADHLTDFIAELQEPEWHPDHIGLKVRGHCPDRFDASIYGHRELMRLWRYRPPEPRKSEEELFLEGLDRVERYS